MNARDWAQAAVAGRWVDWNGLPGGVTVSQVYRSLRAQSAPSGPKVPAMTAARLGRRSLLKGEEGGIRVWADPAGEVAMIEIIDPASVQPTATVIAALGPPEREGAGRHLRMGVTTTEYVYAARGLALTVGESYDEPPSFPPRFVLAQLFAPTTMQGFVLELGGIDRVGPRW